METGNESASASTNNRRTRVTAFLVDLAVTVINELVFGTIARVVGGLVALGVAYLLYAVFS